MRLSDVLGLEVRTESGARVGAVRDVQAELTPRTLRVTGLVVGRQGVLERLGLRRRRGRVAAGVVEWRDVVRVDRRGVVVRDRTG